MPKGRPPGKTKTILSTKAQLRNLTQYRDMTDVEFDEAYAKRFSGIEISKVFEDRIEEKLSQFAEDYDISDLKINDKLTLRALAQAIISLEDYETHLNNIRTDGITNESIFMIEKIQKVMSDLRTDISKMQGDLNITRKVRKGDKEASMVNLVQDVQIKAKKFYQSRMQIVTCPKCKTWIYSGWFLFPKAKNKIHVVCQTDMGDGTKCGQVINITSEELLDRRGYSDPSIIPESLV